MLNALSIDVEDYYHVSGFRETVRFEDWPSYESRVSHNTERILDILDEFHLKATFFFLGWVAERYPSLVRRVQAQGHEIATHGYSHKLVTDQRPEEFRSDTKRSLQVLEDITGEAILGYRAPSYSITPQTVWALDVLQELGLGYDSSLFPIRHDLGGFPNVRRHPHQIREGLWEVPLTTYRLWKWRLPIAGGGYLRLYPYGLTRWAMRRVNREGLPAVVYVHPWEFDPDQPRLKGAPLSSRFRQYQNLKNTEKRFRNLCLEFKLAPTGQVLENWRARQHAPNQEVQP